MTAEQKVADLIRLDPEVWFGTFAVIKDKRGKMIKPQPNVLQKRMFDHYRKCQLEGKACKMVVLKPRQKGASTCAQALTYHHMCKYPDLNGSLMGDITGTSDKVFEIYRRYGENDLFPWDEDAGISPGDSLVDQIKLPSGSVYGKETAGSKNAGRSGTIQVGNMTETAFWTTTGHTDPSLAYLQSLYDGDSISLVVADSTPNGPQGWFYRTWTQENEWAKIFAAWFEFADSVIPFKSPEERDAFEESLSDDELSEIDRFEVGLEQLNWRRRVLQDKCNGDVSKFRQEYPSDPDECFLMSSRPRFQPDVLREMRKAAENISPQVGTMCLQDKNRTASFQPDSAGNWMVYEEPEHDSKYLLSADTCTGEDQQSQGLAADPDFHSVQVWKAPYEDWHGDWHVPRLVALHHSRLDIGILAEDIHAASKWYGGAFLVPEVNNSGLALVKYLLDMGASVYQRRKVNDSTGMVEKSFGWSTDKITRKTIIDHFAAELIEKNVDIPSKDVLDEMKVFVVNDRGKPEAAPGHHDDHVLAAAIALYNIERASKYRLPRKKKLTNRMLRKNPSLLCPDGFMRRPLSEVLKYKRLRH